MKLIVLSQASSAVDATVLAALWTACRVVSQACSAVDATPEAMSDAFSLTLSMTPPAEDLPASWPRYSGKFMPRLPGFAIIHLL